MRMIFLDNAAGSWPKPQPVLRALAEAPLLYGANPGRGTYRLALATSRMVLAARMELADFFCCPQPERLIFTAGATESINMALFGLLQPGSHVIISGLEHNAVWRPLAYLQHQGQIELSLISPDREGRLAAADFAAAIQPHTKL
ncbi:MAG: aminotransferase class V-fold PLP-dependent enzyme, partial [Clostridiales bacterium]|nr:aminotransferase class V-fold PLP-dependent enzyme [Clostridiales bacterium]